MSERSGPFKIVYVDDGVTKVLRAQIIDEDLHTYTCKAFGTNEVIVVGKAALVKVCAVGGGR